MKIKARVTLEADITEAEARILVEAANINTETPETLKRMADIVLKKAFPNASEDSYIAGCWLDEIAEQLGMEGVDCDDLDFPERSENESD